MHSPNAAHVVAEKYRVERLLGEGGMGAVYQAEDTDSGTWVAVKLMHEQRAAEPEAMIRFHTEANALAAVRHQNVVSVMDAGSDNGVPYLVMEMLEGESLESLLRRQRRLPARAAVWIAGEILAGLAATHAQGIVHRDLKPGNVFLARLPDGSMQVKLLDFGVSKLVEGGPNVTHDGTPVGTPVFMAPEQLRGDRVDARTDLYATGVVLYRMLSGRWPWAVTSPEDIYDRVLEGDIRPLRDVAPELSTALECAVRRALDHTPSKRYANASMMRSALLGCVPEATYGPGDLSEPAPPMVATGTPHQGTATAHAASNADNDPHKAFSIIKPANISIPTPPRYKLRRALAFVLGATSVAVLTLSVLLWRGQSTKSAAAAATKSATAAATTEALRVGIVRHLPNKRLRAGHDHLVRHLGSQLGRPVRLVVVEDATTLANQLVDGKLQLAAMSRYSFVRAQTTRPDLRPLTKHKSSRLPHAVYVAAPGADAAALRSALLAMPTLD